MKVTITIEEWVPEPCDKTFQRFMEFDLLQIRTLPPELLKDTILSNCDILMDEIKSHLRERQQEGNSPTGK